MLFLRFFSLDLTFANILMNESLTMSTHFILIFGRDTLQKSNEKSVGKEENYCEIILQCGFLILIKKRDYFA